MAGPKVVTEAEVAIAAFAITAAAQATAAVLRAALTAEASPG